MHAPVKYLAQAPFSHLIDLNHSDMENLQYLPRVVLQGSIPWRSSYGPLKNLVLVNSWV